MSPIRAVTFDLWQTLLLDNRERGRIRAELRLEGTRDALARAGHQFGIEHLREAYQNCFQHCQRIRQESLDISFRQQVEIFLDYISPQLTGNLTEQTTGEVLTAYSDAFFVHPPSPHPESMAVLQGVKELGMKIGLISNTGMTPGAAFRKFLEQHQLLSYFDTLVFSDEVRLSKPAQGIFRLTMESLGAAPHETVHVGDNVLNDVQGANQFGLKTVWIEGFSEGADPADPTTLPDVTVSGLGGVVEAIEGLIRV